MTAISAKIIIEDVNVKAIKELVADSAYWVREEFEAMRKTGKNYLRFLDKHNFGFVDWHTNEYLSHDREQVLLLAYLKY